MGLKWCWYGSSQNYNKDRILKFLVLRLLIWGKPIFPLQLNPYFLPNLHRSCIWNSIVITLWNYHLLYIYKKTLETFPAAEILLTAAIVILAAILNLFIYTQNWRIMAFTNLEKTENENNNLDKTDKFVESKHVPIIDSDTYL